MRTCLRPSKAKCHTTTRVIFYLIFFNNLSTTLIIKTSSQQYFCLLLIIFLILTCVCTCTHTLWCTCRKTIANQFSAVIWVFRRGDNCLHMINHPLTIMFWCALTSQIGLTGSCKHTVLEITGMQGQCIVSVFQILTVRICKVRASGPIFVTST